MSVQNFIKSVAEEKDNFILDEAWRLNEDSLSVIVPVLRKSKAKRSYITFAEAKDVKVEDTGQIDYVYVTNNEEKPLLISRGEIFRGKTQERASVHGAIIKAGKGMRVAVRCIHRSKGINSGAEMKYGGRVPSDIDLSNQQSAWNSVTAHYSALRGEFIAEGAPMLGNIRAHNVHMGTLKHHVDNSSYTVSNSTVSPDMVADNNNEELDMDMFNQERNRDIGASDDLVNTLDDMSDMIKEMLKKIPPIKNQVGAIFLVENAVKGLDIYDLPDSWKSVKEDVVAKEGSDYLKKEDTNIFEFKPEKVKQLIGKKLGGTFEEKVIYDTKDMKIIEVREVVDDTKKTRLCGEAVEFNNKIIHLTMYQA